MKTLDEVRDSFGSLGGFIKTGNGYNVVCPLHDDDKPSLSIKLGRDKIIFDCKAKCLGDKNNPDVAAYYKMLAAVNLTDDDVRVRPKIHQNGSNGTNGTGKNYDALLEDIAAIYDYRDEAGSLLYQCVKYDTAAQKAKGRKAVKCRMRKPGVAPGYYKWNLDGVRLVLYRLKELLASDQDDYVFIVEGEKDVENAKKNGLIATCNPTGAGSWTDDYSAFLANRICIIIPDNDAPGEKHANEVYDSLLRCAPNVTARILQLEGMKAKGDVSDWFDLGHTADELRKLADDLLAQPSQQQAPQVQPPIPPPPPTGNPASSSNPQQPLITIDTSVDHLPTLNAQSWQAVEQQNDPPVLFLHGTEPVRACVQKDGSVIIEELNSKIMRNELSQMAHWVKTHRVITKPPMYVVEDVLASRVKPLPPLNRVVSVPVFAPDGSLQTSPGYNPASGVIYSPLSGFSAKDVPDKVLSHHLDDAKKLVDELIWDFPFDANPSRTNAISLFLLPIVRDLIDGPTPFHLIESPIQASGKGLLLSSLLWPSMTDDVGWLVQTDDESEWEKRITTKLREAKPAILIDNIDRPLTSGVLASAITGNVWSGRLLGENTSVNIKVRCIWGGTGNNVMTNTDMASRSLPIRITPQTDRPEERDNFRHSDLPKWVTENRTELVWAAHVICKYAIQDGIPAPKIKPVSRFSQWSRVMAGILEKAGYADFLANYKEFQNNSNTERNARSLFCITWYEASQKRAVQMHKDYPNDPINFDYTSGELVSIAEGVDGFPLTGQNDRGKQSSIGRWLASNRDVITICEEEDPASPFAAYKFCIRKKGKRKGNQLWECEQLEEILRKS